MSVFSYVSRIQEIALVNCQTHSPDADLFYRWSRSLMLDGSGYWTTTLNIAIANPHQKDARMSPSQLRLREVTRSHTGVANVGYAHVTMKIMLNKIHVQTNTESVQCLSKK